MKEKLVSWIHAKKWHQVISFVTFCVIALNLFLRITYLFRSAGADDHSEIYNRNRIIGIKEEQNLDMVYVSGSEGFVYWEPPRAWAEYGIKSYNYATNSIPAEAIIGNIREIRKTQDPELFVVGLRSFQYWGNEIAEPEIRYITDSMDYSWNRWKMVYEYLSNRTVSEENDVISLYFDIAKYHTNMNVLKVPERWKLSGNEGTAEYKGWLLYPSHEILNEPEDFKTEERGSLDNQIFIFGQVVEVDVNGFGVVKFQLTFHNGGFNAALATQQNLIGHHFGVLGDGGVPVDGVADFVVDAERGMELGSRAVELNNDLCGCMEADAALIAGAFHHDAVVVNAAVSANGAPAGGHHAEIH